MDARQRQPINPARTDDAESLIRALRGVHSVRVEPGADGIGAVHVAATDDESARHLATHVRSALLAGLGTPLVPGRIHVTVHGTPPADGPAIRLLHEATSAGERDAEAPSTADSLTDPDATEQRSSTEEAPDDPGGDRIVLVTADTERSDDDQVVCRVSVSVRSRLFRARDTATDGTDGVVLAAARACVRALVDAGIPGIRLDGIRAVHRDGRAFAIVSLHQSGPEPRTRSGIAPVLGRPAHAAAEATVAAALALL